MCPSEAATRGGCGSGEACLPLWGPTSIGVGWGAWGGCSVTQLSPVLALQDHLPGCVPAGVQATAPARGLVLSRLEQS